MGSERGTTAARRQDSASNVGWPSTDPGIENEAHLPLPTGELARGRGAEKAVADQMGGGHQHASLDWRLALLVN